MNTADKKLVCFASGTGSIFSYVARSVKALDLPVSLSALITDVKDCGAVKVATEHAIPVHVFPDWKKENRQATCQSITHTLETIAPDLIVLLGFMKILSDDFVTRWGHICLNTHPALLPAFRGAHGVADALSTQVTITGATVHRVTAEVDGGEVLFQRPVLRLAADTEQSLHERIKLVEQAQVLHAIMTFLG